MSAIQISDLTFAYEGSYDTIFEHVHLTLDTDWRLGFIGRNGRGKTTFLRLLLGKETYEGRISASVDFTYFPYEVADKSQSTLDIVQGICADFQQWELERELSLLRVAEDALYRPFETLSNGEQTKVLLAALFLNPNHFLLIDEPTNHLDQEARALVSRYLQGKQGYILVSHDRTFLDNCVDHVLSINKVDITVQAGNFSSWLRNKELQDQYELAENRRLQGDIRRLEKAAKRTADWSDKVERSKHQPLDSGLSPDRGYIGHKAAKMMARSKAIEGRQQGAIAEKSALLRNVEEAEGLKLTPLSYHKERLLECKNMSLHYGEKTVCQGLSFFVERGERVALEGSNGSGKSSILQLLLGEKIDYTGDLLVGSQLVTSYVPQDTAFLQGSLKEFAKVEGLDESLFKAILRKLDFSRVQLEKPMEDFSGGQKKKVLLARSLCKPAHLYIWDEPLNFVDVLSRMQLEELLITYAPTMLFVEHDRTFCEKIATKTVKLG